jgi:hypothetical protein
VLVGDSGCWKGGEEAGENTPETCQLKVYLPRGCARVVYGISIEDCSAPEPEEK